MPQVQRVVAPLKVIIGGSIFPVDVHDKTAVMRLFLDPVVRTLILFFPRMLLKFQNGTVNGKINISTMTEYDNIMYRRLRSFI